MKKLFKILVVLIAAFVVLLVIGSILLHVYLPPEKAKALVLERLSAQLKREVDVGSVSVGVLSGLQMSDLKISESPNFSKGTFISSDLFSLKVALAPLLFRKVIVRQILLRRPNVTLIREADGKTFSFSDLTESTVPAAPPGKGAVPAASSSPEAMPFLLVVSRAEIQNGTVHFIDHSPAQATADVSALNLVLKGVSLTNPFSMQTSMNVKTKGQEIGVRLAGQVNLAGGTFKIASGGLDVGPIKMTIAGMLSQLKSASPACKIHLETNDIPVREALKIAPLALPEGLVLDGTTRAAVEVSGTAEDTQFAAKWHGTNLLVAKGDDFAKPSGFPLEASIAGSRNQAGAIVIKSLTARLGANEVNGSGSYRPAGKDATIDFSAKGTNWSVQDLAKVSPLLAPYHPTGSLSFDTRATGPLSAPQTVAATSAKLVMANVKQDYYEGKDLQLNWNLTDITPDLAKVNGTAALKQGPGKILNVDKLAATTKIGKIVLAPLQTLAKIQAKGALKQINLPSMQTISFTSAVGDYLLKSGTVNIKSFNLNGNDLSVENQGTVGLAGAQPIHLNVAMKLAAGSVGGELGELIKDSSGRPTIKFLATGTVENPQVKLDVQEVGKKAIQKAGQEILKNPDVQKAVDDLGNTLKGIFH